ncbi:MAG: metallophosphoesterase [Bradymonadia bacterium]
MIRILHTSDLHGRYKPLLRRLAEGDYDLWIDTGDFLPNPGRPSQDPVMWSTGQQRHQRRWMQFKDLAARLAEALDGRPAVMVQGNHDFIPVVGALRHAGVDAHGISPDAVTTCCGLRFSGFREVSTINGRWVGEVDDDRLWALSDEALSHGADVLVTHSPPRGVLDGLDCGDHFGAPGLAEAMEGGPRLHLFGHVHEHGGQQIERGGVVYANGATQMRIVELGS